MNEPEQGRITATVVDYDERRHELTIEHVDGRRERCDPYVSGALQHYRTSELIGQRVLISEPFYGQGGTLLCLGMSVIATENPNA